VLIGVLMGVPTGESCFFDLGIDSRCFLFRLRGRGFGDACGLSGERSFFVMVIIDRSYVGSVHLLRRSNRRSRSRKQEYRKYPDVCKNVVLKIIE
jgi:hypothetical protein